MYIRSLFILQLSPDDSVYGELKKKLFPQENPGETLLKFFNRKGPIATDVLSLKDIMARRFELVFNFNNFLFSTHLCLIIYLSGNYK